MTSIAVKEIHKLCPRDRVIAATLSLITSEGVDGLICGLGPLSYILAIEAISKLIYNK